MFRNILITSIVLAALIFVSGLLLNIFLNWNINSEFEQYVAELTMTEENFDEEIETLNGYLDELTLSDENKGKASNMISTMYNMRNQTHESILYMCKAIHYYQKLDERKSLIQMSVNLSAMLINNTSYDMAESLLSRALDLKLSEEEQAAYHIYIYTNLAECTAQRGDFDQAIEAVQLAESKLELVNQDDYQNCILSLKISKAIAYQGLGEIEKCKAELAWFSDEFLKSNVMTVVDYAIPYYEVLSYVALSDGDIKKAQDCFEKYIEYCETYSYNLRKLAYIDNFTKVALSYGFENVPFIHRYEENLLDYYRAELERSNQESSKILLDTYNTTVENVTIHSRENMNRLRVYGGSAFFFIILTIIIMMLMHIRKKSQTDFLTGAFNRMKLRSVYRALIRKKQNFYVIMFDIDDFKRCNDIFGHRFGDRVLENIAKTVNDNMPKASLLFRYGGEEFVVLCDLKTTEEVQELAELLRSSVEALEWENGTKITISIGVSGIRDSSDPLKLADQCLYDSKNAGKNKVTYSFL